MYFFSPWSKYKALQLGVHLILLNILSPQGSCESRTEGGPIVFTYVLFVLGNDFDLSKSQYYGNLFFFLEMFYPPKGAVKAEPKVVQLFLLMFYLC